MEIDWARIERFLGFGRRDAPVVFIGMEEGLKRADALVEDLKVRSTYEDVMDLKEAHNGIAGTERYFDPDGAPRQPTWRVMADLMLRREGLEPNAAARRRYRALELGRARGDTLLSEVLPYPHPKSSDWLYEEFGRFRTRREYESVMFDMRTPLLRRLLRESRRELVICYGKSHWPHYEKLFEKAMWTDEGPHRVARWNAARVVLTTHFSDRGFNTEEQLSAFARVALESNLERR